MAAHTVSIETPYRLVALQKSVVKTRSGRDGTIHLGRFGRRLEELHCQFIQDISHTKEGAQRHFRRGIKEWEAIVMALSGETIVGYATVQRSDTQTMELSSLFVETEYRRRGLSKGLINGAEQMARRLGADYLQMIVAGEGVHGSYVSREGYAPYPGGWKFVRKPLNP